MVTNWYECVDVKEATIVVDGCLGVDLPKSEELQVYPNPNNGQFTIELDANGRIIEYIKLINLTGDLVWEERLAGLTGQHIRTIDLDLAKGVYFIEVRFENHSNTIVEKVIIQ